MNRMCAVTTAMIMLVGAGSAPASTAPTVSPATGSDAVLALRAETQGELWLEYRVERPGSPPEAVTIGLARDYHYRNSNDGLWIYDYRLRRIFRTQPDRRVINDSLYADAWVRAAELENRAMIVGVLSAAGVAQPKALGSTQPYWAETELGVISPKFPRPELRREEASGRVRWLLGEDEVVAVRYRHDPVPEAVQAGLRRLWPTIAPVHPQIADELAGTKRLPEELWVREMVHGGKSAEVLHWRLVRVEWREAARFPLPPGLTAVPTDTRGAFPEIFATLVAAVTDQRKPPAADVYTARVESAIKRREGLEAMLWIVEMQLAAGVQGSCSASTPPDWCLLAARAGPLSKADPRSAIAFANASPDAADRPKFDDLPNAYVLRLLWATRTPGKEVKYEQSEQDLLAALQASPIANFCKDTGDFYAHSWRVFAAWQAWDLGRLMAAHRAGDLLERVDTMEAEVVRDLPALF